jgi:predicted nucleic acid-binding protein
MPIADLIPRAYAISVATYDSLYIALVENYIALVEKRNIPLVTADERLIRRLSRNIALVKRMIWVDDFSVQRAIWTMRRMVCR